MSTAVRRCTYCDKPTLTRTVAVDPSDPDTARAALDHPECYAEHLQALGRLHQATSGAPS